MLRVTVAAEPRAGGRRGPEPPGVPLRHGRSRECSGSGESEPESQWPPRPSTRRPSRSRRVPLRHGRSLALAGWQHLGPGRRGRRSGRSTAAQPRDSGLANLNSRPAGPLRLAARARVDPPRAGGSPWHPGHGAGTTGHRRARRRERPRAGLDSSESTFQPVHAGDGSSPQTSRPAQGSSRRAGPGPGRDGAWRSNSTRTQGLTGRTP
jgi:hypothetical protein